MANILIVMYFLVHLMGCLWYMTATLENNILETWVGSRGIDETTPNYKYWNAFYWSF